MKAAIKFIMISVGLTLLAVAIGAIVFSTQLEGMLRTAAEDHLGYLFETDVHVEAIRIAPVRKGVKVLGLTLQNPPSFKEGAAIYCERLLVLPQFRSLFSREPVIREVALEGLKVNVRHEVGEGTNLGYLAKRARSLAETQDEGEEGSNGRLFRVRQFTSTGARMKVSSNMVPGVPLTVKVEPFVVEELTEGEPVTPAKLSAVFLRSLVLEVVTLKGFLRPVARALRKEVE